MPSGVTLRPARRVTPAKAGVHGGSGPPASGMSRWVSLRSKEDEAPSPFLFREGERLGQKAGASRIRVGPPWIPARPPDDTAYKWEIEALWPLAGRWPKGHQNVQTEVLEVAIAKAAAIEHLDFWIDAFGKAVAVPTVEVVQDALTPIVERLDKGSQGT